MSDFSFRHNVFNYSTFNILFFSCSAVDLLSVRKFPNDLSNMGDKRSRDKILPMRCNGPSYESNKMGCIQHLDFFSQLLHTNCSIFGIVSQILHTYWVNIWNCLTDSAHLLGQYYTIMDFSAVIHDVICTKKNHY